MFFFNRIFSNRRSTSQEAPESKESENNAPLSPTLEYAQLMKDVMLFVVFVHGVGMSGCVSPSAVVVDADLVYRVGLGRLRMDSFFRYGLLSCPWLKRGYQSMRFAKPVRKLLFAR